MATCIKPVTFYGCTNASGTTCTKILIRGYTDNSSVSASGCATLLITGTEYSNAFHPWLENATDAEAISGALILLLAIGFIYKAIRSALDVGFTSDEKH